MDHTDRIEKEYHAYWGNMCIPRHCKDLQSALPHMHQSQNINFVRDQSYRFARKRSKQAECKLEQCATYPCTKVSAYSNFIQLKKFAFQYEHMTTAHDVKIRA